MSILRVFNTERTEMDELGNNRKQQKCFLVQTQTASEAGVTTFTREIINYITTFVSMLMVIVLHNKTH